MSHKPQPDWHPLSEDVSKNQLEAYDKMRAQCPVAYSERHQWSLFRHEDVTRVLHDHETFSNNVSAHISVPNGMDPPEHTPYRKLIEPYFDPEPMAEFEPVCRDIASALVQNILGKSEVDIIGSLAQTFALQVQCAFLGWPITMQEPLRQWSLRNQEATLAQDREALVAIAEEFSSYIRKLLETRRAAGDEAPDDITTHLLRSEVNGRRLTEEEIVSILRNWTAGEIGSIAASIGILVEFLARHQALQKELREQPEKLPEAIDEILRIHGPLVANRRKTTCPVNVGGRALQAGEGVSILWVSANRDEEVFEDAHHFRWGRDQSKNLLYGAGVHLCPGAPLARLELLVMMEELLARTENLAPTGAKPVKATYPASGFSELTVRIT